MRCVFVLLTLYVLAVEPLPAATYMPISDADLIKLAPVIVRAQVLDRTTRVRRIGARDLPFTIVTLLVLETFKGSSASTIHVRVPGGTRGERSWWIPGTPAFEPEQEVVLMLDAIGDGSGEYGLTEFGLAKFDMVSDGLGRQFAVRPVFPARSDLELARVERGLDVQAMGVPVRDGESFLTALRGLRSGRAPGPIAYAIPTGAFQLSGGGLHTEWANLGGPEPSYELRWFWDNGQSPAATVVISGTQTNLGIDDPCGTDSACYVQNAVTQWHGIEQTDVRISGPGATGNLEVRLDATTSPAWTTPMPCEGGALGVSAPSLADSPMESFKGDSRFSAIDSGTVWMRKSGCTTAAVAGKVFKTAVMHEIGHCLGLAHPNQYTSIHSSTPSASWLTAVMTSSIQPSTPSTPQTDDIQAMQYFYGTAAPGAVPTANFSFSPAHPNPGDLVSFTNTSTGSPNGYVWIFGDPGYPSYDVNPTHTFGSSGTYFVRLDAGNLNGTGTVSRTVIVGTGGSGGGGPGTGPSICTANETTLCLSASRFKVTAVYDAGDGRSGQARAIPLTANTGYFWFFDQSNVEVVTKILPFCANPYNSIWVFAAGLTNVEVTLTYTDTKNGTVVTKKNNLGTAFEPIQDTGAFKTCP